MVIFFRILYVLILFVVVFLVVFWNISRMKGSITVTVNGETYPLESMECKYIGEKNDEKIAYDKISSGIKFKNRGLLHGMYEYSFLIENEKISITPQIRIFKTSWWRFYNINIDVNVYEDNEIWDADIFINVNNHIYQETFNDIENNIIEFRVE